MTNGCPERPSAWIPLLYEVGEPREGKGRVTRVPRSARYLGCEDPIIDHAD